ncbi:MAG: hypothetical protein RL088_607 [Verrucomicrobiota bacterium]
MCSTQTKPLRMQFLPEFTLLTFKTLEVGFSSSSRGNLKEIRLHQRRDRGSTFGRSNSRHPVGIIIYTHGDVLHDSTVPQIHSFTSSDQHRDVSLEGNLQSHHPAPHVQQANKSLELTPYMRDACCSATQAASPPHSSRSSASALAFCSQIAKSTRTLNGC